MIRFNIALLAGKITSFGCKILKNLLHRGGSNLPGKLALKIDPLFLSHISKPKTILAVTGSNGKTTTTNMVADIFEKCNFRVATNRMGSNINTGIATCLLNSTTLCNKSNKDIAVLEVDERSSLRIYPYVHPDFLLVTNLSRDSLKRNAHPFFIRDFIQQSLPNDCVLVLNADDLISASIKPENKRVYYGIDRQKDDASVCCNLINDLRACPRCGSIMATDFCRYNHIGRMHCPACGLKSPIADVNVKYIDYKKRMLILANGEVYPLLNDGIFNIYDEIAAIALLRTYGIDGNTISNALLDITITDSRYSEKTINGVHIIRQMAKGQNATACSSAFKYVCSIPGQKEILLILEDPRDQATGTENPAYLYETDFEFLNSLDIEKIIISGKCLIEDVSLRLQLAGIPQDKIIIGSDDPSNDVALFDINPNIKLFIIHDNYQIQSAMSAEKNLINAIQNS